MVLNDIESGAASFKPALDADERWVGAIVLFVLNSAVAVTAARK